MLGVPTAVLSNRGLLKRPSHSERDLLGAKWALSTEGLCFPLGMPSNSRHLRPWQVLGTCSPSSV